MQNRKLGIIFLVLSILIALIILQFISSLTREAEALGCYTNEGCVKIESNLNITHLAFGAVGFVFALSFYLVFFARGEELLMKRLKQDDKKRNSEEEFALIARGLDEHEKKVLQVVREQEGITQNTLLIKAGMSKAKLSYVLQGLEKKGLVARSSKGKTLAVYS